MFCEIKMQYIDEKTSRTQLYAVRPREQIGALPIPKA